MSPLWRNLAVVLACIHAVTAQGRDAVFDLDAILAPPLNARTVSGPIEKDGMMVEEVRFFSERDGDTDVEIFGILAYPRNARELPAFVWNQGGLSQASDFFPIFGAKRGYAALCIDFPIRGYRSTGGYPINAGLSSAPDPRAAPIYHGAVALLRAVSFLESRPEVDKDRIGMCGSSWGGFFTTLMIGIDPRLKAGSAMFGCGFLGDGNAWWGPPGSDRFPKPDEVEQWMSTLDPGPRLADTNTPIGWFTGTADMFYWMPAVMKSYLTAAGPRHLALYPNWAHGLPPEGDESVFVFLDAHLRGTPALLSVSPRITFDKVDARVVATWEYSGPREVDHAELILSYGDPGNWVWRYWRTLPATIEGNRCRVELPASSLDYHVSGAVVDRSGFRSSTVIEHVDVKRLGLHDPLAPLEFDGCAEWGGFEPAQADWQRRHGFMKIDASPDAAAGVQSHRLHAGANRLFPIYFAAGVAHRFTAQVKADRPVSVELTLHGASGPGAAAVTFDIAKDWTTICRDIVAPDGLNPSLEARITVPEGAMVLIDDVTFRPVSPAAPR